jgi:hypothetical protein
MKNNVGYSIKVSTKILELIINSELKSSPYSYKLIEYSIGSQFGPSDTIYALVLDTVENEEKFVVRKLGTLGLGWITLTIGSETGKETFDRRVEQDTTLSRVCNILKSLIKNENFENSVLGVLYSLGVNDISDGCYEWVVSILNEEKRNLNGSMEVLSSANTLIEKIKRILRLN